MNTMDGLESVIDTAPSAAEATNLNVQPKNMHKNLIALKIRS